MTPSARLIIDVRLNNVSQLAGFAKKEDLKYFAQALCGMDYVYAPDLAPTADILDQYKKGGGDWSEYEKRFIELIEKRKIDERLPPDLLRGGCLLCSEHQPHHCHRRLVATYLCQKWGSAVKVTHLV